MMVDVVPRPMAAVVMHAQALRLLIKRWECRAPPRRRSIDTTDHAADDGADRARHAVAFINAVRDAIGNALLPAPRAAKRVAATATAANQNVKLHATTLSWVSRAVRWASIKARPRQ